MPPDPKLGSRPAGAALADEARNSAAMIESRNATGRERCSDKSFTSI
jgi:hypothetical protein